MTRAVEVKYAGERGLWGRFRAAVSWIIQRLGLGVAQVLFRPPAVDGVRIAVFAGDVDSRVAKVTQALKVIAQYTPHRYRHLVRHLRWILVLHGSRFQFLPAVWGLTIESDWLDRASETDVACVIIHEATHARLWRLGFRYEPESRERIERVCVRAEAELLRRLGVPGEAEAAMERLEDRWWEQRPTASS